MALRTILTSEDATLRKKSRPVTDFSKRTSELMDDLRETLSVADGLGLAAPQVGILRRAAIIIDGENTIELINPEIIERSGGITLAEGCLSVPGKAGYVERPQKVKVKAQDRNGEWFEFEVEEMSARAACHEIDHLDGILYIDRATKVVDESELEEDDEDDEPQEE